MRTSPRALLVAGVVAAILVLLSSLPRPAQAVGLYAVVPPDAMPGLSGRAAAPGHPSRALTSPEAQHLLDLVNRTRWEHGQLPPLKRNAALERAALGHSQSMAQNNFFGHKGVGPSSPWDRIDAANYGNWYVLAEIIAAGPRSGEDVIKVWLESPQHRESLLRPDLSEAGIGYVFEEADTYPGTTWGYQYYWTLDMGCRSDAYPLVIAGEAFSTTSRNVPLYVYGAEWATEMRLSNDGVNWSAWMPHRPTLDWALLPGNGARRVYGEIRNAQGTVMHAEDEIILAEP